MTEVVAGVVDVATTLFHTLPGWLQGLAGLFALMAVLGGGMKRWVVITIFLVIGGAGLSLEGGEKPPTEAAAMSETEAPVEYHEERG